MMGEKVTINGVTTDTRTLAEAQAERLGYLETCSAVVISGGHTTATGVRVGTDPLSLDLINGANQRAAAGAQTSFTFQDAAGNWDTLTAAQMQAVFNDVSAFLQACLANKQSIAAAVAAATTNAAVDAVDVTQGWPS